MLIAAFVFLFASWGSAGVMAQSSGEVSATQRSEPNSITLSYTHDRFDQIFDPWNTGYVQLSRQTPYGSALARVNMGSRFETTGYQPQIDFYPSLVDGMYGYLNAGYSNSSIFPQYRFGAELFKSLPRAFEVSAGFRHLRFSESNVTILTGSLTKYIGNYLFTARPYVTPNDLGVSSSLTLIARKYFSTADNYITMRGGFGFSPEERTFQLNVNEEIFLLQSSYIGIDGYKEVWSNVLLFASVDGTRQEIWFDPGEFFFRITLNTGLILRF
ncbi:MAG: YaiO family outer membrane beta-barrel protein [Balneolaceae bacterium]